MRLLFARLVPYTALLGTGVGVVAGGQQVNLSLAAVLLGLLASLATADATRLRFRQMILLRHFGVACLPGVAFLLAHGGPAGVPAAQFAGICGVWIVVWTVFRHLDYCPERIFDLYLRCACASAAVGVVQELGYLARIAPLYDMHWVLIGAAGLDYSGPFLRAYGLFTEPSYFASFLVPALYFAMLRLTGRSLRLGLGRSALLIAALLCTFSTIGYIGLLLCMVAAMRLSPRNIAIAAVLAGGLGAVAMSSESISSRLDALPNALSSNLEGDENMSALINGLNIAISQQMLSDHPVTGIGLGAYRLFSQDYLDDFLAGTPALAERVNEILDQLTLADGGSMYIRLATELGAAGWAILLWLWARTRRGQAAPSPEMAQIATAALLHFAVFGIRSGQLVRFEVLFFLSIYSLIRLQRPRASPASPETVAKKAYTDGRTDNA
jgi:hypothetical protein